MTRRVFGTIYGPLPWLVPPDEEELQDFFRKEGAPFEFKHRSVEPFGYKRELFLIEEGLVATIPQRRGGDLRVSGLFGINTVLGAVSAVRHGNRPQFLEAIALTEVRGRTVELNRFLHWFEVQSSEIRDRIYKNPIEKTECQLDGVFVNDRYPIGLRFLLLLEVLYFAAGKSEFSSDYEPLPWQLALSEMAMVIHTSREMVSRACSEWIVEGTVKKVGRKLFVNRARLRAAVAAFDGG